MGPRLIFSASLFVSLCYFTSGIEISQDGGNSLHVVIHQGEAEPSIGVAAYIENIKSDLSTVVSVTDLSSGGEEDDEVWLKSPTALITVVGNVVLGCFIVAGAVSKYKERKKSKKAAGTRFARPSDRTSSIVPAPLHVNSYCSLQEEVRPEVDADIDWYN